MADVSLRQLEYLVAAAETGSVTAAATRLYLSQSAVSSALADLETALGVQLFIRQPRGLALTQVGHQVLTDARRLLSGVEDLRNSARESSESLSGGLTVGCYSTLAPILLPRIIAAFTAEHPAVDLSLVEGSHQQLERALRDGTLDLALLYDYEFGAGTGLRDFTRTVVLASPPHVVLPADHRLAGATSVRLRDLVAEPLILFDLPPAADYFLSLFTADGLQPRVHYRTSSYEMVRSLVARGLGYSVLSQRTAISVSYEGREFATVPLAGGHPGLDVNAVHLAGMRPTRRATAFLDECRRCLT